jgi:hypothetical protein
MEKFNEEKKKICTKLINLYSARNKIYLKKKYNILFLPTQTVHCLSQCIFYFSFLFFHSTFYYLSIGHLPDLPSSIDTPHLLHYLFRDIKM